MGLYGEYLSMQEISDMLSNSRNTEIMRIGESLVRHRKNAEYGDWLPMLKRYKIPVRKAQSAMQVYERFMKSPIGKLPLPLSVFRELIDIPDTEIVDYELTTRTAPEIRRYKKTGELPEPTNIKPNRVVNPEKYYQNRNEIRSIIEELAPESLKPKQPDQSEVIAAQAKRIADLEKQIAALSAKFDLIVQLMGDRTDRIRNNAVHGTPYRDSSE